MSSQNEHLEQSYSISCSSTVDDAVYEQILKRFSDLRSKQSVLQLRNVIRQLKQDFCEPHRSTGLSEEALSSLLAGAFQQEQKWRHRAANWSLIFSEYKDGQPLLALSAAAQLSPRLVAQKLITEMISERVAADDLKSALADSNQIDEGRLAFEAMLANYCDPVYGAHAAHVAANCGSRFEQQVADGLRSLNAHFASEKDLRPSYDVTPDFKLTVPLVLSRLADSGESSKVESPCGSQANDTSTASRWKEARLSVHDFDQLNCSTSVVTPSLSSHSVKSELINWIECKALFANADVHEEHTRNQLDAYGNRFGKGLVLYQHGCVQSLLRPNTHFVVWPGQPQFARANQH
jgi:hypothetical protein